MNTEGIPFKALTGAEREGVCRLFQQQVRRGAIGVANPDLPKAWRMIHSHNPIEYEWGDATSAIVSELRAEENWARIYRVLGAQKARSKKLKRGLDIF